MFKEELKGIIKVACIYTASVVGAGFASGQELLGFFVSYRGQGFCGILFAGILFSLIGFLVLDKVYACRIRNYRELLYPMTGLLAGRIAEVIAVFFMMSVFCVMVAGAGKITSKTLGLSVQAGILIIAALCALILLGNIRGVVAISTFLTPVLIAGIIAVSVFTIASHHMPVFADAHSAGGRPGWLASSILYVSYNSIASVIVMSSLLPYLKTRNIARMGGILGGLILCIMAAAASLSLFLFTRAGGRDEFPMLEMAKAHSSAAAVIYALILWLAMFLSAVTSGFCLTDRLSNLLKVRASGYVAVVACAVSIPLSSLGFSRLIGVLYPVFGYLGLFMVLVILIDGARRFVAGRKSAL